MGPGQFEYEFAERVASLLRAVERRRARAELRRGLAYEGGSIYQERRWRELRDAYAEAMDLLRRANDKVYGARLLLLKIGDKKPPMHPEEGE